MSSSTNESAAAAAAEEMRQLREQVAALQQKGESADAEIESLKREVASVKSTQVSADGWRELCPPVYPEGDYVGVFCRGCGGKNRQDEGWRYRDDPMQKALERAELARFGLSMGDLSMLKGGRKMAQLTYECERCRTDEKRRKDEDDEEEEDEE